MVAIGLWSLKLSPGKLQIIHPPSDIRITNVSLDEILKDNSGRSVVKIRHPPTSLDVDSVDFDENINESPSNMFVLCPLRPGSCEQAFTDITLQEDEEYTFEVTGKNAVYLSGNFIDQLENNPPFEGSELEGSSEDVEDISAFQPIDTRDDMHSDSLPSKASRFEEVEEVQKSLKRSRKSDLDSICTQSSKVHKKKQKGSMEGKSNEIDASIRRETGNEKNEMKMKKDRNGAKPIARPIEKLAEKPAEIEKAMKFEREIAGGIKVFDAKLGTGPEAKKGKTVHLRYIGKLHTGKVFDKNVAGKPFSFHLGKGEVIKGWDEGIVGMQVGGERRLTIPPELAYGKKVMDDIPKNSTLIFEVKLLRIN